MTTPRDLIITAMDVDAGRPVTQGDLSLALAGAEVIDLIGAEAVTLDGDLIVPGLAPAFPDPLLDAAAAALIRTSPYESVEDWLWRRGRGLAAAYQAALEDEGVITLRRAGWAPLKVGRQVLADSAARREAAQRWAAREPVLAALARAVGVGGEPAGTAPEETAGTAPEREAGAAPGAVGEAVTTVLATVGDAVMELEAVRQRRAIEEAAFDNVWRGFA